MLLLLKTGQGLGWILQGLGRSVYCSIVDIRTSEETRRNRESRRDCSRRLVDSSELEVPAALLILTFPSKSAAGLHNRRQTYLYQPLPSLAPLHLPTRCPALPCLSSTERDSSFPLLRQRRRSYDERGSPPMASVSSVSILQSAGGALKLALLPQIISSDRKSVV